MDFLSNNSHLTKGVTTDFSQISKCAKQPPKVGCLDLKQRAPANTSQVFLYHKPYVPPVPSSHNEEHISLNIESRICFVKKIQMKEANRIPVQNNRLGPELSREALIQADENLAHVLVCFSSLPLPPPTPCIFSALQIFSLIVLHPSLGGLPEGFVSVPFNITSLGCSPNKDLLPLILTFFFVEGLGFLGNNHRAFIGILLKFLNWYKNIHHHENVPSHSLFGGHCIFAFTIYALQVH